MTFNHHELQDHFAKFGHQEPRFLRRAMMIAIDLTSGFALIAAGAILLGAVLATLIFSAKIFLYLGIPALLVLIWRMWRD